MMGQLALSEPSTAAGLAVVVAPGPRPDPDLDVERLQSHREFYLKSAHTVVSGARTLRYRPALGKLSYRAQLGLRFDVPARHTPADEILEHLHSVVLAAEIVSVDLLQVGWEGTMWHVRYGEGGSFDDSCLLAGDLIDAKTVLATRPVIEDPMGPTEVEWSSVAEFAAYVNGWMELREDVLLLAGSSHGPVLSLDGADAVVRFPPDELRVGPGDEVWVRSPQLGEARATVVEAAKE